MNCYVVHLALVLQVNTFLSETYNNYLVTIRMYADRKKLPLERIKVTLTHDKIWAKDCDACETKVKKVIT
jgi:hypothetical protein